MEYKYLVPPLTIIALIFYQVASSRVQYRKSRFIWQFCSRYGILTKLAYKWEQWRTRQRNWQAENVEQLDSGGMHVHPGIRRCNAGAWSIWVSESEGEDGV